MSQYDLICSWVRGRPRVLPDVHAWTGGLCPECGGRAFVLYRFPWGRAEIAPCTECGGTGATKEVDVESPLSWCPEAFQDYAVWLACVHVLPIWERWAEQNWSGESRMWLPREVLATAEPPKWVPGPWGTSACPLDRMVQPHLQWPPGRERSVVTAIREFWETLRIPDPSIQRMHAMFSVLQAACPLDDYSPARAGVFLSQWRAECEWRLAFVADGSVIESWDRSILKRQS